MSTDQVSFYDESLKKQLEGSFVSDGNAIHVGSAYGSKSAPYTDMGACHDFNAQVLLAKKLLSELARDAAKDEKPLARDAAKTKDEKPLGSGKK